MAWCLCDGQPIQEQPWRLTFRKMTRIITEEKSKRYIDYSSPQKLTQPRQPSLRLRRRHVHELLERRRMQAMRRRLQPRRAGQEGRQDRAQKHTGLHVYMGPDAKEPAFAARGQAAPCGQLLPLPEEDPVR